MIWNSTPKFAKPYKQLHKQQKLTEGKLPDGSNLGMRATSAAHPQEKRRVHSVLDRDPLFKGRPIPRLYLPS